MQIRDPFRVLGLPASFDISAGDVQSAFLRAMARLHPDVLGGDADGFDEHATARAAELNLAREQVLDDVGRAESLLSLKGGASVSEDKRLPAGFLAVMMEAREELDAAMEAGDAAAVDRSVQWGTKQRATLLAQVRASLEQGNLSDARQQLNACRSVERMLDAVGREASE
jgi:DnaJ-domain-containing protein 1